MQFQCRHLSPDSSNRRTRDHHRQSIKKNTRMFQGQCTVILYWSHSPLPFRIPAYISFCYPVFPFSPPLLFNCIIQYFIYFFSSFRFVLISCIFFMYSKLLLFLSYSPTFVFLSSLLLIELVPSSLVLLSPISFFLHTSSPSTVPSPPVYKNT